jgi:NAD(P)-dependent dehydrogenase (short-subunit alcohol dehydrogenase family)
MKDFRDKVAAVTGAGSGIGRALALELAARGCALALSDIDQPGLLETLRLARAAGAADASASHVDVADRDAVFGWAGECRVRHGKVNLLFNNAGVALNAMAESTRPEDFAWLMGINFWGVVNGCQAFLPHLRASGDGHVVNISSVFGLMAMPTQSVRGFTEALRMELELGGVPVGVTCVHPGGVATNIARAGRVDPAMAAIMGMDADQQRERGNRMIQRTTPQEAARQILSGVERNARRVLVGPDARVVDWMTRLLGSAYQVMVLRQVRRIRDADLLAAKGNAT